MRTHVRRWGAVALGAVSLALLLNVLTGEPAARADDDTTQGWTVWQDGKKFVFPFKERWTCSAGPAFCVARNAATGVEIHFYGTCRIEHRTRDQR